MHLAGLQGDEGDRKEFAVAIHTDGGRRAATRASLGTEVLAGRLARQVVATDRVPHKWEATENELQPDIVRKVAAAAAITGIRIFKGTPGSCWRCQFVAPVRRNPCRSSGWETPQVRGRSPRVRQGDSQGDILGGWSQRRPAATYEGSWPFARPPAGQQGVLVISAGRGLLCPETRIDLSDIAAFAEVSIDPASPW